MILEILEIILPIMIWTFAGYQFGIGRELKKSNKFLNKMNNKIKEK